MKALEPLLPLLPIFLILSLLAGAGLAVKFFLAKVKGQTNHAYRLKTHILTPAEQRFWKTLRTITPPGVLISFKTRLADIFEAAPNTNKSAWQRAFNRISAKHVDFLLLTEAGKPLLAIELDDRSHDRPNRMTRDQFVNETFKACGLPLLRIPNKRDYNPVELRDQISTALQPPKPK